MIGACALSRMANEFKDSLPDKGKQVFTGLASLGPLVCPKSSVVTALIPVAVDLVKWIIKLAGSPTETLLKEIDAWIRGPAADETDPLLAEINASLPD